MAELRDRSKKAESQMTLEIDEAFFELPDLLLCLAGPDGYFKKINSAWEQLLGYSNQELLASPWLEFVHPDDLPLTLREGKNLTLGKGSLNFQNRYKCKDGSYKWLHWTSVAKNGVYYCIARDITRLKESESHAQESADNFNQLSNSIPMIVWTAGPDGAVDFYNEKWYEFTGTSRDIRGDASWLRVLHPDDRDRCAQTWNHSVHTGEPYEIEYRFRRACDGMYRWYLGRATPVKDSSGQVKKWFGTCTDIHDQKSSNEVLQKALKDLSDIRFALDQSTIIATTDAKGIITYVNEKFCEISQYSREELVGRTHKLINSNYHPKEFFKDLWTTISSGRIWRGEVCNRAKDGSLYWVDTVIIPFVDEIGKPYQFTAIRYDIRERKKNEAERANLLAKEHAANEASRLKSEFLANMSHEIRTPINGVVGMTGLLLDTPLTDEQRSYTDSIKRSGEALLTVINDILDFSKIEAGHLDFDSTEFNLLDAIHDAQRTLAYAASKKNIDLRLDISSQLPQTLIGDSGRLKQVLLNLMSNAVKFTQNGHVILRVHKVSSCEKKACVQFEVEDSGIGIAKESLRKMFAPFTQADSSTQRKFGGTGLGLSICKKLVEKMNGQIGVDSLEGRGSKFWFHVTLPIGQTKSNAATKTVATSLPQGSKIRALVADDNTINQIIAVKMLEKMGIYADVVANGLEAVKSLAERPYDIVLMDCQMPEMDGYEATRQIRISKQVQNSQIPILAMTANAMKGDAEKCLEAGMNDYMTKPMAIEKLEEMILRWVINSPSRTA